MARPGAFQRRQSRCSWGSASLSPSLSAGLQGPARSAPYQVQQAVRFGRCVLNWLFCVCAHLNACVGQREGRGGGGEETDGTTGVAARLQWASNSPLDASSPSRLEAAGGWRTAGWWQRAPGLARGRSRRIGMSREPGVALGFGPGPFGLTIPSLLFSQLPRLARQYVDTACEARPGQHLTETTDWPICSSSIRRCAPRG